MSKITRDVLIDAINTVLQTAEKKKRKFRETVELQVVLKNYDPQKDKRFSGNVRLKYVPRPRMTVCVLGDQQHIDEANANNLPSRDVEALKKLNKDKKAIKKLGSDFCIFCLQPFNRGMTLDVAPNAETDELLESRKLVRYDRQLRLWEQHGQDRLEKARVCLLNATATGCEALKSLVLPGIGSFTIVDGDKDESESAANNFFLDFDMSGQPKAKMACERLMMLNPEVVGNYVNQSPEEVFSNNPHFFDNFSVVIGTNLSERFAHSIGEYLWIQQIPFLLCKSYGLVGYLRIVVREHCVFEARPENPFTDFMLDEMAAPLLQFADSLDIDGMNYEAFKGLPYLLLIVKALDRWRLCTGKLNALPETSEEVDSLKACLESMAKSEGRDDSESISTNVVEALAALNKCVERSEIPENVWDVLKNPCARDPKSNRKSFWILAHALKCFVENEGDGRLPLRGSLPDMSSDTDLYIRLQNIYKEKAHADALIVHSYVSKCVAQLGKCEGVPQITFEETKRFCRNAAFLRVIKGRSLKQEFSKDAAKAALIESELKGENRLMIWYLLLRAAERFHAEKGRYPGTNGIPVDLDKNDLAVRFEGILHSLCTFRVTCPELIQEMCRFGAAELHCVAAIVGGLAAQEVVKLVTGQYIPINNTFVYDGHRGDEKAVRTYDRKERPSSISTVALFVKSIANHLFSQLLVKEFPVEDCPREIERVRCWLEINQSDVLIFWIVYFNQPHLYPCIVRVPLVGEVSTIELQVYAAYAMTTTLLISLQFSLNTNEATSRHFMF
ncbi:hypothetical protein M513_09672 [Trichuris suis]|uniref:THIF-type NAD/FAD binding fold domain-containing protein n=1 Tax=Trichuris suis TaxID=68888 RepID=A0A085LWQ9_9BILA|nr:hypothetical protein M513_09672 [Trichuris suis]